jgi:SAM-dependent methyltransferase
MPAVSTGPVAYRDFYYPLNVFMHILTNEEGDVPYLHYGLFENAGESLPAAQERSTQLLLSRLPAPPARLLDVGIGLGTTLQRLAAMGYVADGITPDPQQIGVARARFGDALSMRCVAFEDFAAGERYDAVFFQESSQYIDSAALFARAATLTDHVIVLDEFALRQVDLSGALHGYQPFLDAARQHGFTAVEELDLSSKAPPSIEYFLDRFPRYREPLIRDLGLTDQQVDDLVASGRDYRELYRSGAYGYRLVQFRR